jgi:imidazole glycerol-phosphate synthase subunit HisH
MAHDGDVSGSADRGHLNVAIFDYGTGNLHSLAKAFEGAGAHVKIEPELVTALQFDALVLPGVGAFGPVASKLSLYAPSLRAALASGHPCFGICLGMQLLFESSEEGEGAGLAAFRGRVRRLTSRRVPHMGWNDVEIEKPDPLFDGVEGMLAYYANSYVAETTDEQSVLAWSSYDGERFPAAVRRDKTWGVQFHPEKSGELGLQVIRNFIEAAQR